LAPRRQVLKRVSDFDSFSSCYPDNQLKAKGAVAAVAELINRKDSFTRLQQEYEEERRQHREMKQTAARRAEAARQARDEVKADLFRLFGMTDTRGRGKALEDVLNRLFFAHGILVREAFVVVGEGGEGVIEQIDGAIEIDGRIYLVEMKWWDKLLGRAEVASHLVSVYGRAEVGGIFISASGYHDSAVAEYKTALTHKTVILVELQEIVRALEHETDLPELIRQKLRAAELTKRPLVRPLG
jgi:restriction endonuclease Mrr